MVQNYSEYFGLVCHKFFNNTRIFSLRSENNLVKTIKCLVDPTKYLVDSISNCLVVLAKSKYLVDLTKKFISINQNLFDLTKFSWISNKTVLLVKEIFFSFVYTGWSANSHKALNVKFFVKNQTTNHIDKMLREE